MMFDPFVTTMLDGLRQTDINQASQIAAVVMLLIEKGVFTAEEYDKAYATATHVTDQYVARKDEEAEQEYEQRHPGVLGFFRKIIGDDTP